MTSHTMPCPGVYWVGAKNPGLRRFDVVMHTEYGTTYNAYLIVGNDKTALVETVKDHFEQVQLDGIREITDVGKIDYIILNHTEPDHTGALPKIMAAAPNAQVLCTRAGAAIIREIVNRPFDIREVSDGDSIDLGGATLEFIMAPFLHWPDSMFTYCREKELLLSGDVFGCHFSSEEILESRMDDTYLDAQKYYFDVIMGPFKPYVLSAIEKIRALPIKVIGPAHGPVLDREPLRSVERYESWAKAGLAPNDPKKVFIGYVSCYGYTRLLGEEILRAVVDAGLSAEFVDISLGDTAEIAGRANGADGVLIGSSTLNRDALPPVWEFCAHLSAIANRGKKAGAFGAFGWSGEACKFIEERLKNLGYDSLGSVRTKMKPDDEALKQAYAFGGEFAKAIKSE